MGKIIRCCMMLIAVMFVSGTASKSWADVTPGDIYKDYTKFQARAVGVCGNPVTGSWASGLCKIDPAINPPVSMIVGSVDISGATKAEVYVSYWGGHVGTTDKKFRVNGGEWQPFPIPVGLTGNVYKYQITLFATVPVVVPTSSLVEGNNNIEVTAGSGGSCPFYWLYSVTVRVYYGRSKLHPTGTIEVVPEGRDKQNFTASATPPSGRTIKQVDYIGNYKDFNWEGDGLFQNWHYTYKNGIILNHIGTATSSPYPVTWVTDWIPDQDKPMKAVARIVDSEGYCFITDAVNPTFSRNYSVKLFSSYDVPEAFYAASYLNSSYTNYCHFNIDTMTNASAAKLIVHTWNGAGEIKDTASIRELGVNGTVIAGKPVNIPIGVPINYAYNTYDIQDLNILIPGLNTFYMKCNTVHHSLEVNWPGPVILVKYNTVGGPSPSIKK